MNCWLRLSFIAISALPTLVFAEESVSKGKPDPNGITIAIVAASGLAAGAIVTAIAAAYSARQKIKEVELTYQQRLRETYLTNARQYTNSLYVPLSIALGKLDDAHRLLQSGVEMSDEVTAQAAFRRACASFSELLGTMSDKGADAFLTTQLEDRLRSFSSFLTASSQAKEPLAKAVFEYRLPLLSLFGTMPYPSVSLPLRGKWARIYGAKTVNFTPFGHGLSFESTEVVAAPYLSKEFTHRFTIDISVLKYLVKEVTLGTHAV